MPLLGLVFCPRLVYTRMAVTRGKAPFVFIFSLLYGVLLSLPCHEKMGNEGNVDEEAGWGDKEKGNKPPNKKLYISDEVKSGTHAHRILCPSRSLGTELIEGLERETGRRNFNNTIFSSCLILWNTGDLCLCPLCQSGQIIIKAQTGFLW